MSNCLLWSGYVTNASIVINSLLLLTLFLNGVHFNVYLFFIHETSGKGLGICVLFGYMYMYQFTVPMKYCNAIASWGLSIRKTVSLFLYCGSMPLGVHQYPNQSASWTVHIYLSGLTVKLLTLSRCRTLSNRPRWCSVELEKAYDVVNVDITFFYSFGDIFHYFLSNVCVTFKSHW